MGNKEDSQTHESHTQINTNMHLTQIYRHHSHRHTPHTHTNTDTSIPCRHIHRHTADPQREVHTTYKNTHQHTQHTHTDTDTEKIHLSQAHLTHMNTQRHTSDTQIHVYSSISKHNSHMDIDAPYREYTKLHKSRTKTHKYIPLIHTYHIHDSHTHYT